MPTLADGAPGNPERRSPYEHRSLAESFGADARRYDRARPSYPDQVVDHVRTHSPGPRLLDVGIGTGIAARLFRRAGFEVTGVEVDPEMARVAREDGFAVDVTRFEDWTPDRTPYDAVIAAQTWHWIEPEAGAAKAAACLRPGGLLSLFWNIAQPPPELAAGFAEAYETTETGLPFNPWARDPMDGYAPIIATITSGIAATGAFTATDEQRWHSSRHCTRAEFLDQVPTYGGHSRIPAPALAELLTRIGAVIDDHGGSFDLPYVTVNLAALRRLSAAQR